MPSLRPRIPFNAIGLSSLVWGSHANAPLGQKNPGGALVSVVPRGSPPKWGLRGPRLLWAFWTASELERPQNRSPQSQEILAPPPGACDPGDPGRERTCAGEADRLLHAGSSCAGSWERGERT